MSFPVLNRRSAVWAACAGAALLLAACDGGPSAVAAREHGSVEAAGGAQSQALALVSTPAEPSQSYNRAPAVQMVTRTTAPETALAADGKPYWSPNRTNTGEENAQARFESYGADFQSATVDEYVAKVHAFVDKPPAGSEVIERANGDRLIYDAKSNVFAVVAKTGAPRTMFHPRDGAAYWAQQKGVQAKASSKARDGDA